MKTLEFKPRFIKDSQVTELAKLWHLSRVHSNNRYERMLWTSKEFAKMEGVTCSATGVYKDLDGWLHF